MSQQALRADLRSETGFHLSDPLCMTEELRMLREQVRRFVEREVAPHGEKWEADGMVPREIFLQMGELGLLGMRHAEEHGGTAMGPLASVVFAEELGRSSFGGFTATVTVHTDMSSPHISISGNEEQKRRYLPDIIAGRKVCAVAVTEPWAGSDVAGLKTRAARDGDSWVINGAKMFITNGVHGDVFIVAARTDPAAKGSRGISLFIVEKGTPGFSVARKLDKHGWLCSDTAELVFQDCRVPAENLLGQEGRGFYAIMGTFQNERLVIGAMASGEAQKAIELTLDYVRSRTAFGGTLWSLQATRQKLAELVSKTAAARALTYQTAALEEAGHDTSRDVSIVKAYAPEVLHEVVHGCLQLHGGTGYMRGTAIERMARDARILMIGGGATEVMLEEVAKRI
jgi:alkylation response protein AidB-like acyl-CoA dehydrogenase